MYCWHCHLAGPLDYLLLAKVVCDWFLWLLPRVTKNVLLLVRERVWHVGTVGSGGKILGGKSFLFDYFSWGCWGLSCSSWAVLPSPSGYDHPTASCSSVLAGLPLPCCWQQADLFSLSVLLSVRVCLQGDAVLPGLWSLFPRCSCLAGSCSAGLVPWSTGLHAARAPDRPLCGRISKDGLTVV